MKKICLTVIGIYLLLFSAFSQDSTYKSKKLSFEEANFVSSYYHQEGEHAAVTGGTGPQTLTDISNSFDLKLYKYDKAGRKNSFLLDVGFDHYTSASSDKIDPKTISSASHADTRIYPALSWTRENETRGSSIGAGVYFSSEFDYQSRGVNISCSQKTKDRNGEFSAKLQAYLDQVKLVTPVELRIGGTGRNEHYGTAARNSFSAALSWSQVVNKNLQVSVEAEPVYQHGYLGLPFNRVYFNDGTMKVETLPSSRFKFPIAARANYFLGDALIVRAWYRYYQDSWKISSHTVQIETAVKLNPFFSVTPFYRFYMQSGTSYFAAYGAHQAGDSYFTSNFDLSTFNSNFYGIGIRTAPPNGVLHIQHLNAIELRYGHYQKNIQMNANIISLNLNFK